MTMTRVSRQQPAIEKDIVLEQKGYGRAGLKSYPKNRDLVSRGRKDCLRTLHLPSKAAGGWREINGD